MGLNRGFYHTTLCTNQSTKFSCGSRAASLKRCEQTRFVILCEDQCSPIRQPVVLQQLLSLPDTRQTTIYTFVGHSVCLPKIALQRGLWQQTCFHLVGRARPMYRHSDVYRPIWRCCRCIVSAKFRRYISAIFAHISVALLLCMKRSETQVATLSLTLFD